MAALFAALSVSAQPNDVELADPKPGDLSAWAALAKPVVGWGSIDVRYSRSQVATVSAKAVKMNAWKGERVSAQAVVSTPVAATLKLAAGDLRCGKKVIAGSNVHLYFVRYTLAGLPKNEESVTLQPDRLDAAASLDIPACSSRPVWVEVKVPADAAPGLYKGTVSICCNGKVTDLPYQLQVADRVLPEPSQWAFHLDLWQNPYAVARYFEVPLWSEDHFALMRPLMTQLAQAGCKVVTASIIQHPWNSQTYDPFESMIAKMKQLDGSWVYDYKVFDKWIEFMMSCGISGQIDCYTLVPWQYKFDYYDCATNSVKLVECKPQAQEYRDLILPFLKDFAAHLKAKGWFDRTCIAMDERPMDQMAAAYAVVKEADPGYRIAGAANYNVNSAEADNIHDMSVAYHFELFSPEAVARRKANGSVLTFYTCCSPARPNTFTFSDPAESAFLAWHAAAVGYDGYLRWAYNSWPAQPNQDSRFGNWKSGDAFLVYPGGSSIRFERLVEGIQDFEKMRILRETATPAQIASLDAFLVKCSPNKFGDDEKAEAYLSEGKALLVEMSK